MPEPAPVLANAIEPPMHYTECRALGHEWHHQARPANESEIRTGRPWQVASGAVAFASTCSNCGTERTKWMGYSGALFPTTYKYPDGYERRGEDERMSQLDWRRSWIVRTLGT